MNKGPLYIIICIVLFMVSCQDDDELVPDKGSDIYISASVEETRESRAPYTWTVPSKENEIHAAVWASSTRYKFQHIAEANGQNNADIAMHTKANFQHPNEQLLIDIIYPKEGKTVYFVGMYPETLGTGTWWSANADGTTATSVFSGSNDIMFAPETSGTYGTNVNPHLKFHHLLTWLKIQVVAESEEAKSAWGNIKEMKIKSLNTVTVEINHGPEATDGYDRDEHVSFSNPVSMDFFIIGDKSDNPLIFPDDLDGSICEIDGPKYSNSSNLNDFIKEVAYVMCAPVDASESTTDYVISIVFDKNERKVDIPVNLMKALNTPFTGSTMGYQFTILLKFKIGDNIAVSTKTNKWKTGGIGYGLIEE